MLSFFEMQSLCEQIDPLLQGAALAAIYEIDTRKWVLLFEKGKEQIPFLISVLPPYHRFHLLSKKTPLHTTPFTKHLEKKLRGALFKKITMLHSDRILQITFQGQKEDLCLIAELFFKHPQVVLTTSDLEILESLEKTSSSRYIPPLQKNHKEISAARPIDSYQIEKEYDLLEKGDLFRQKAVWIEKQLEKKKEKTLHRIELHKKEKTSPWKDLLHLGELLKSHFHLIRPRQDSIILPDWKDENTPKTIPLDPDLSPHQNIEKYFKSVRKLKKAESIADHLIEKATCELKLYEEMLFQVKAATQETELNQIIEKSHLLIQKNRTPGAPPKKRSPFRSFQTDAGLLIFVGKTDLENDRLSFSFANGSDLWFHSANTPGSHVVLKKEKKQEADEESIQDALQLALYFSKAKERQEEEVVMTECKFLSRSKSAKPGQVQLSKHRTIRVRLDEKRLQRLISSKKGEIPPP
ncbi:MAG: DUF814 domain-containing protein [Chlamydiales bacterium]|nr:DUF814 domain-containing protein [Chlamydiales bacterium]